MAAADITRIKSLTTALLNANSRNIDGTPVFSPTVGDDARSSLEIAATCINAALMVGKAICESDSSPFRVAFLEDMALTHGSPLPFHYGDTTVPVITPFSGATFTLLGTREAFDRIDSYRTNRNNAYGAINHNVAGTGSTASDLAGYYDIINGIFYFTGYSALMKLANFNRTDVVSKLPDAVEPTVVKLACGLSGKEGDTSDGLFAAWYGQGMADLNDIKSGASAFQPLDDAIVNRGDNLA